MSHTLRVKNGRLTRMCLPVYSSWDFAVRKLVDEEILEGISLERSRITFDLSPDNDSGDENTLGYSPLGSADSGGSISNEDSDKVLNAMAAKGQLGLRFTDDGDVLFDRTSSMKWLFQGS